MHIPFVEIQNFRKLLSVRLDLSDHVTLCVGANNSGKTSAMLALGHFLIGPKRFTTNDFTLSNWHVLNTIGEQWEAKPPIANEPPPPQLRSVLPTLDLWLEIDAGQLHHVRGLLPSLDWAGPRLGVRLCFEPKDPVELTRAYLAARQQADATKAAADTAGAEGKPFGVKLWPHDLRAFLDRKLHSHFALHYYLLDPTKVVDVEKGTGQARPQPLPAGSEPLEGNPLRGLVRIDEIAAQRGLGEAGDSQGDVDVAPPRDKKRLTEQLRSYYTKHLDPVEFAEPEDVHALQAIDDAQQAYNARLATGFKAAIDELEDLNYPGVFNPRLKIATRLRPIDGLNHSAAVQYDLMPMSGKPGAPEMSLPEEYNGLGYQNLISMVFRLMGFRDAWMRVGKASKEATDEESQRPIAPLHLVIVEEPEAHLHAQVQQVFVKKAYDVLRNRPELRSKGADGVAVDSPGLRTQMVVSTHSSHVAHECEFAWLRYFRRRPMSSDQVPTSSIVNLSQVFGTEDDTRRFVKRYLRSTHCELFFADAAILVEGSAERMLVPHFIRHQYGKLHCAYVTLLEIDGSHAHRLRSLIESLGLTTLVIGDLDPIDPADKRKGKPPKRGAGYHTGNATLKSWNPGEESIDKLLDLKPEHKIKTDPQNPHFAIRVAFQTPMQVKVGASSTASEALASTFEDALVLHNLALFKGLEGDGDIAKVRKAVSEASDAAALTESLYDVVGKITKAAFALELLYLPDLKSLHVPPYIAEGLGWLEQQVDAKKNVIAEATCDTESSEAT